MRAIEIVEEDYVRLQAIATPFVDTPATVISRLLDMYGHSFQSEGPTENGHVAPMAYNPDLIPPLTHTKVMAGELDGVSAPKASWDALVCASLTKVLRQEKSIGALRTISGANVAEGRKESDGYKFVASENFSYQGVSAKDAVKIILRCARALAFDFSIEFVWRDKDGAHLPGKRGIIRYPLANHQRDNPQ